MRLITSITPMTSSLTSRGTTIRSAVSKPVWWSVLSIQPGGAHIVLNDGLAVIDRRAHDAAARRQTLPIRLLATGPVVTRKTSSRVCSSTRKKGAGLAVEDADRALQEVLEQRLQLQGGGKLAGDFVQGAELAGALFGLLQQAGLDDGAGGLVGDGLQQLQLAAGVEGARIAACRRSGRR